jgi:cyclic pyranopterin phosphate synthase
MQYGGVDVATARAMSTPTHLDAEGRARMGDIRAVAEIAGVMAAKGTAELIPLCHPLLLPKIVVEVEPSENGFAVRACVKATGQTGVEMEALTAVSVACLTIYDMLKAVDRYMVIEAVHVTAKSGGRTGDWTTPV